MEKKIIEIKLTDILPNRFQPRIKFKEDEINALADSIKSYGVLEPIIVRPIGDKYEIIAGERRYKASSMIGKETIPAVVINLNDADSAEVALIENVQRQDLTPIEEAISYKKILDMGHIQQEKLAEKLGKKQSTISNKLRLLNLEEDVQEALLDEMISERHARSLLRLNKTQQIEVLKKIIEERLTVRKTDDIISDILNPTKNIDVSSVSNQIQNLQMENDIEIIPIELENKESYKFDIKEEEIPMPEEKNMINPGFMDIDKIESEAEDINTEKPKTSFDFLSDLNLPKQNDINPIFNIDAKAIEPLEKILANNETLSEEKTNLTPFTFTFNNEEQEVKIEDIKPRKDPVYFDFSNFNIEEEKEPLPQLDPMVDYNNEIQPNLDSAIDQKEEKEPLANILVEEDINQFNYQIEEENPTPVYESTNYPTVSRESISIIREAVNKIESLGYIVDMDELDMEKNYRIEITIDKK